MSSDQLISIIQVGSVLITSSNPLISTIHNLHHLPNPLIHPHPIKLYNLQQTHPLKHINNNKTIIITITTTTYYPLINPTLNKPILNNHNIIIINKKPKKNQKTTLNNNIINTNINKLKILHNLILLIIKLINYTHQFL